MKVNYVLNVILPCDLDNFMLLHMIIFSLFNQSPVAEQLHSQISDIINKAIMNILIPKLLCIIAIISLRNS